MGQIEISVELPASVDQVWNELADLASHVEWMSDAKSITFLSDRTEGAGTRMEVATKVLLFRTKDVMEFVVWEPPSRMAVRHRGLVSGLGEFSISQTATGSLLTWREGLRFPPWLGGRAAARFVEPVLSAIWRRNLRRFAGRFP